MGHNSSSPYNKSYEGKQILNWLIYSLTACTLALVWNMAKIVALLTAANAAAETVGIYKL